MFLPTIQFPTKSPAENDTKSPLEYNTKLPLLSNTNVSTLKYHKVSTDTDALPEIISNSALVSEPQADMMNKWRTNNKSKKKNHTHKSLERQKKKNSLLTNGKFKTQLFLTISIKYTQIYHTHPIQKFPHSSNIKHTENQQKYIHTHLNRFSVTLPLRHPQTVDTDSIINRCLSHLPFPVTFPCPLPGF